MEIEYLSPWMPSFDQVEPETRPGDFVLGKLQELLSWDGRVPTRLVKSYVRRVNTDGTQTFLLNKKKVRKAFFGSVSMCFNILLEEELIDDPGLKEEMKQFCLQVESDKFKSRRTTALDIRWADCMIGDVMFHIAPAISQPVSARAA